MHNLNGCEEMLSGFLLNAHYPYISLHAIVATGRSMTYSSHECNGFFVHTYVRTHCCRVRTYVHDKSFDISRLVGVHVLWYFTPRVNQNVHGKFSNFPREYLCVITRGLSRVCEVIVELYRSIPTYHRFAVASTYCRQLLCGFISLPSVLCCQDR